MLTKVVGNLPDAQKIKLLGGDVDQTVFARGQIPLTADHVGHKPSTYTPTGFSLAEVEALGDFPDYAELSGVPLPTAYEDCVVEKALPRPYRPFRWLYRQTMCMIGRKILLSIAD